MRPRAVNSRLSWWGPTPVDALEVSPFFCPTSLTFDSDVVTFDSSCPIFQLAEEGAPFLLFSFDSLYHKFSSIYTTMDEEN